MQGQPSTRAQQIEAVGEELLPVRERALITFLDKDFGPDVVAGQETVLRSLHAQRHTGGEAENEVRFPVLVTRVDVVVVLARESERGGDRDPAPGNRRVEEVGPEECRRSRDGRLLGLQQILGNDTPYRSPLER